MLVDRKFVVELYFQNNNNLSLELVNQIYHH